MSLLISPRVREKLANKTPPVSREEICECFATRDGALLVDDRETNKTTPPTQWFISDTYAGRLLKVVFVMLEDGQIAIKTAYDPNEQEKRIYNNKGASVKGR
jgi:hypothetical protein